METSSFLPFPDLVSAQARSADHGNNLNLDGISTTHWWQAIELTDGTAVLEIRESGPYGVSHETESGHNASLTSEEQAQLVPYSKIADRLPKP